MYSSNREKTTRHEGFDVISQEILKACVSTDPIRLAPFKRWLNDGKDLSLICAMNDTDPNWSNYEEPAYAYLATELMSKSGVLDVGIDRKHAAMQGFFESEDRCGSTNKEMLYGDKFRRFSNGETVHAVEHSICRKIDSILQSFSWDEIALRCDFGSGANVQLPRKLANRANKIGLLRPTVAEASEDLARTIIQYNEMWSIYFDRPEIGDLVIVPGNRITTVPKNYKTDRVIAIEPMFNSLFQKGIGSAIAHRLRRHGVDLRDQTVNQRAALEGSKGGTYATIDLKQASDSLALRVVELLLPPEWVDAMRRTRSEVGVLPCGEVVTYQKFSSMGNAFTFELESLIFYSIAWHCSKAMGVETKPIVYGDDIVVDEKAAPLTIEVLSHFGFETNQKKTHFGREDAFRESCGKHYLRGIDISPFYIRNGLQSDLSRVLVCNNIRRFAARQQPWGLDKRMKHAYEVALKFVPKRVLNLRIPDGYGDGALIGDLFESAVSPIRRSTKWWDGWITEHYPEVEIRQDIVTGLGPLMLWMWDAERKSARGNTPLLTDLASYALYMRDSEGTALQSYASKVTRLSHRKRTLFVSGQWNSSGPWM